MKSMRSTKRTQAGGFVRLVAPAVVALWVLSGSPVGGWQPTVRFTYNDSISFQGMGASRGVAASGDTVHVVWYDGRDGGNTQRGNLEIYYKRSTDNGATWGPDTRMTFDTAYSGYPTLAVWGSTVHLAWVDNRDRHHPGEYAQIYYKRSTDAGETWSADQRLRVDSSAATYGGWNPCLAVWENNVHAVWEDDRGGDDAIYHRRSTDGGLTWGRENPVSSTGKVGATLAISGQNLHVAYWDYWGYATYYQRSTNNGASWSAPVSVPSPAESGDPSIAASGPNVHLAFVDARSGSWDVWYTRSTNNGVNWSAPVNIAPDEYHTWQCNIAAVGNYVHVVRGDMGNYRVHYLRSTNNGASWQPSFIVSEDAGLLSYHSFVAVSGSTVHVTWDDFINQRPGGGFEIFYRRNVGGHVAVEEPPRLSAPGKPGLECLPNPFRDRVEVCYFVPQAGRASLRLYDAAGALAAVLADGRHEPGRYRLTMGRKPDRALAALSRGIYLLKLETADGKETMKLVVE